MKWQESAFAAAILRWRRPDLETSQALLAGVMMTTGLPPYRWTGPLVVVALAMLFGGLVTARRPVRTAWLFGLAHQTTLLYWLFFLDPAKSIPTRALVPLQAILAILYVSLFYLLFGWLFQLARRRLGAARSLALAPVSWTAMEALRGVGELAFPWCLSGSAWLGWPVERLAATSGEIGLSAATAFSAAAVVILLWAVRGNARFELGAGQVGAATIGVAPAGAARLLPVAAVALWLGLIAGTMFYTGMPIGGAGVPGVDPSDSQDASDAGARTPLPRRAWQVAVVQADVALEDKWDKTRIDSTIQPYTRLTEQAAAAGAELVVWAETAVPAYLRFDHDLLSWVRDLAADNGVALFVGFPDAERASDGGVARFNASGLFSSRGYLIDRYAKHHLLPIGERMPFSRYLPFLADLDVGQAEWQAGEAPGPLLVTAGDDTTTFAALICFEAIFADLARQAVGRGSRLLVNITNDGWFGETAGPRQHAELARLRGLECGVPVVRCANNGISFVTDEMGRVMAYAGLGERCLISASIVPAERATLFVHLGAWPLAGLLAVWCILTLVSGRERRPRGDRGAGDQAATRASTGEQS